MAPLWIGQAWRFRRPGQAGTSGASSRGAPWSRESRSSASETQPLGGGGCTAPIPPWGRFGVAASRAGEALPGRVAPQAACSGDGVPLVLRSTVKTRPRQVMALLAWEDADAVGVAFSLGVEPFQRGEQRAMGFSRPARRVRPCSSARHMVGVRFIGTGGITTLSAAGQQFKPFLAGVMGVPLTADTRVVVTTEAANFAADKTIYFGLVYASSN